MHVICEGIFGKNQKNSERGTLNCRFKGIFLLKDIHIDMWAEMEVYQPKQTGLFLIQNILDSPADCSAKGKKKTLPSWLLLSLLSACCGGKKRMKEEVLFLASPPHLICIPMLPRKGGTRLRGVKCRLRKSGHGTTSAEDCCCLVADTQYLKLCHSICFNNFHEWGTVCVLHAVLVSHPHEKTSP